MSLYLQLTWKYQNFSFLQLDFSPQRKREASKSPKNRQKFWIPIGLFLNFQMSTTTITATNARISHIWAYPVDIIHVHRKRNYKGSYIIVGEDLGEQSLHFVDLNLFLLKNIWNYSLGRSNAVNVCITIRMSKLQLQEPPPSIAT